LDQDLYPNPNLEVFYLIGTQVIPVFLYFIIAEKNFSDDVLQKRMRILKEDYVMDNFINNIVKPIISV
jgi:hypothetical protein